MIEKETTIGEVLEKYPDKTSILKKHLHAVCLGCPMSQIETLEEAAIHHGISIDKLLDDLNINSKIKSQKSKIKM